MDRAPSELSHIAAVDGWLDRASAASSSAQIVGLFRVVFEAVWTRAVTTLGSVTLTVIAERVLFTATAQFGFLSAINPRPNGDTRWQQRLQERLCAVPEHELMEGLRFGLIELVTVIGRLTAEILTQELHAALLAAPPPDVSSPAADAGDATTAIDLPAPPTPAASKGPS
jgi:hypothetical protein